MDPELNRFDDLEIGPTARAIRVVSFFPVKFDKLCRDWRALATKRFALQFPSEYLGVQSKGDQHTQSHGTYGRQGCCSLIGLIDSTMTLIQVETHGGVFHFESNRCHSGDNRGRKVGKTFRVLGDSLHPSTSKVRQPVCVMILTE